MIRNKKRNLVKQFIYVLFLVSISLNLYQYKNNKDILLDEELAIIESMELKKDIHILFNFHENLNLNYDDYLNNISEDVCFSISNNNYNKELYLNNYKIVFSKKDSTVQDIFYTYQGKQIKIHYKSTPPR